MKRFAFVSLAILLLFAGLVYMLQRPSPGRGNPANSKVTAPPDLASPDTTPLQNRPTPSPSTALAAASQKLDAEKPAAAGKAAPAVAPEPPRKRAWNPDFLASLGNIAQGEPLRFELVAGEWASGTVQHTEHRDGELIHIAGSLTAPESGRFFFQKQTRPGVAGEFVGVVELQRTHRAYRIEPTGPGGSSELVERPMDKVICLKMPTTEAAEEPEEIPPLRPEDFPTVPIPDYQNGIIVLESLPGVLPVIYMDYQGGYTPTWGGITYERPSANNTQIRDVWKRVAEDYMPFNVNVTTDLKVYQNAPQASRQRVVVTPTTTAAPGAGGVAFIGSFNWTGDTPCWAFYSTGKNAAEVITHESGHTLGLGHDGKTDGTEYYGGQGSGDTGWAPIMGVGYYQNVSQWSKGEYNSANNTQDDLNIITSNNNDVDYRADDTGNSLSTSRYLEIYTNFARAEGVIERTGDTDAFQFSTLGGTVSLWANPVGSGPNLSLQATLYDTNNTLLASNNPQNVLWAPLSTNLPAGTYTFRVTGAGRNNPATDGYSAYASLGYYIVTGTVANAQQPVRFAIPENITNGYVLGTVPANNPNANPLVYTITSGNRSNTFALNNFGALSITNNSLLDYEALARNTQLPVQFEMFVDIVNTVDSQLTERNRRLVVAVTNVNERPVVIGFTANVLEHTSPGTMMGVPTESDPDFYTLLSNSITSGNNNNMFSVESRTGIIRVAGDLNTATQSVYNLRVAVSDQTPPVPLLSTAQVTIVVLPNTTAYQPGAISYAVYTNLSGSSLSSLTNSTRFPLDPGFEKQLSSFEGENNRGDNFGSVLRGYLIPPATGNYTFWIASDDNSELLLSSSSEVSNATRVAYVGGNNYTGIREWTKFASQRSAAIPLVAGQAYYIEARHKEGGGDDNVAVAWQCTSAGIPQEVIPGRFLAPYFLNYLPHVAGYTYNLHRDAIFLSRLPDLLVSDANTNDTHTFGIVSGNPGSMFSMDPDSGAIRVVNETFLKAISQSTIVMQVRATDNGTPVRSGTNSVTIKLWTSNSITTTNLYQEIWTGIGSSTAVSALTGHAKYPRRPDVLRLLTSFDSGEDYADSYGSRIRGLLVPTNTGTFTFYIASDDSSTLKFATNTEPSKAVQVAAVDGHSSYEEWDKYSSQKSTAIPLVAGRQYYIEALQKEGGGGDHVEVAWTGPGLSGTNPIAGLFLDPVDLNFPPEASNKTAVVVNNVPNGTTVTTIPALDSPLDTLAFKIVSGNPGNTFAIDPDNGRLTVTNNELIATYAVSWFTNLEVQIQDSGYGGLYPLQSTQVTVSVLVLYTSPQFTWSGGAADGNWSSALNWRTGIPPENSRLLFGGNAFRTNFNDILTRVGPVLITNGGIRIAGNSLLLLAGLGSVGDNTWAIDSTLNKPQTLTNISGRLTLAGNLTNAGHYLTLQVSNVIVLEGSLSGSGGLIKTAPGTLVVTSFNSYTGETLLEAGSIVLTNSGSLQGSASLELQAGTFFDVTSSTYSIPPHQVLRGEGTVLGDLRVDGLLEPGASLGALVFSNNVTLAGHMILEISKTGSRLTNDLLQIAGELNCGGSLLITNTGAPLADGDSFRLLRAEEIKGAFTEIELPSIATNLMWDLSQLTVSGVIRITSLAAPQLIAVKTSDEELSLQLQSVAGSNYILEATWELQPQIIWTPVSTNSGTGGLLPISVPIDSLRGGRFFRVRAE